MCMIVTYYFLGRNCKNFLIYSHQHKHPLLFDRFPDLNSNEMRVKRNVKVTVAFIDENRNVRIMRNLFHLLLRRGEMRNKRQKYKEKSSPITKK